MAEIDLTELIKFHDKIDNRRHKIILMDVFHLCLNEDFQRNVEYFRDALLTNLKEISTNDYILPVNSKSLASKYKKVIYEGGYWDWYKDKLFNLAHTHRFYNQSFIDEPNIEGRLNVLERIIFFNTPINSEEGGSYLKERGGFLSVEFDEHGPYIYAKFDPDVSSSTIERVIEKDLPEIRKGLNEKYGVLLPNRHIEERMYEKYRLYQLRKEHKTVDQKLIKMEQEGFYDEEDTQDMIKKTLNRMDKQIREFDARST
jgi:hypothetical protein